MRELVLDGSDWQTRDDVYDAFFKAVGAPEWHGRNLDALNDGIATGDINTIDLPYRLVLNHYDAIGLGAKKMADDFISLIEEIRVRGCTIEIVVNGDSSRQPKALRQ